MSEESTKKILIQITENETSILDPLNNTKSIDSEAMLQVVNVSKGSRLWNLKLNTKNIDFTNLKGSDVKDGLNAGESWDFAYKANNLKDPVLNFTETIDTSKTKDGLNNNWTLKSSDTAVLTLALENVTDKPIQEIKIEKQMPDFLNDLKIVKVDGSASIDIETKKLSWSVMGIDPEGYSTIIIEGKTEVNDSEPKSLNPVEITYKSVENYRTGIEPSVEAQTETMSGVDQEEDSGTPGKWNCELEFENESEFELTVRKLEIAQKTQMAEEKIVEIEPGVIVQSNKSWTHEFSAHSATVPQVNSKLDFTVNYEVHKVIIGKITKEELILPVISTEITKTIDPPTVKANANTDMKITNTIINTGSAKIDKVFVKDVIPKDFEPPTVDMIVFEAIGSDGTKIKNLSSDEVSMSISPDDTAIATEHTISTELSKLADFIDPKCKILMKYPIIARNPQPNEKYETPVTIIANTVPEGLGYEDKPATLPVIGIQYIQRKVKTMKSISPAGENAYNVTIKITNKGGVELENISVVEEIPKGFIARDFVPEDKKPTHEEADDKIKLTWEIARLDPNESIKLKYIGEGSGEFPRVEPKVIVAEPESLKKEMTNDSNSAESPKKSGSDASGFNGIIEDVFNGVVQKIKDGVSYEVASKCLEEAREDLLNKGKASPTLHEISNEVRDMAKLGSKMLFGDDLENFKKKLNDWKKKLQQ